MQKRLEKHECYKKFLSAYKDNILTQLKPKFDFDFEVNNTKYEVSSGNTGMFALYAYFDKYKKRFKGDYNICNNLVITRNAKMLIINGFATNIKIDYFYSNVLRVVRINNDYYHIHNQENVTEKINNLRKKYFKAVDTTKFIAIRYNIVPILLEEVPTEAISSYLLREDSMMRDNYMMHLKLSI